MLGDSNVEAVRMNTENNEMAIDRRNKLPQRSAGNMRRVLMHPRDPVYIYCANNRRYREIEMRLAVRRPIPCHSRSTFFFFFFSRRPRDILFSGTSRARFSRRLILQSHCIKSKACIKQPFVRPPLSPAPVLLSPGHLGTRPRNPCYGRRMSSSRVLRTTIESLKGTSKCNFRPKALVH